MTWVLLCDNGYFTSPAVRIDCPAAMLENWSKNEYLNADKMFTVHEAQTLRIENRTHISTNRPEIYLDKVRTNLFVSEFVRNAFIYKYDDNLRASKTIETVVALANLMLHVSNRVKTTR